MNVTFNNIAGYENEKIEAINLCNMIENFQEFKKVGVKLPKGLLLYGNPGVGKTLFAKAIANKIKRNFIEVDYQNNPHGSINDLLKLKFKEAASNSPSIIFIDELDKLVPLGGPDKFMTDDSRETLSLLLSLLDGFNKNESLLVIATTNVLQYLPEALTRSGRIDKHIGLNLPDSKSREAILKHYLSKLKLKQNINFRKIVTLTENLSGADIETIVNEAAIKVISAKKDEIKTNDLIEFINKIISKQFVKHTNEFDSDEQNKIVAYHELGHFIVANVLKKEIREVSVRENKVSLGRVRVKETNRAMSKTDIFNQATILLGGRASELIFLNDAYAGSYADIEQAINILKLSIGFGDYGMEHISSNVSVNQTFGRQEYVSFELNEKIKAILKEAFDKAYQIVLDNKEIIEKIHPILVKESALTGLELSKFVNGSIVEGVDLTWVICFSILNVQTPIKENARCVHLVMW